MTINRKILLENLKMAMPGIESGNVVLQGSDSFIFHEGRLFTYNDSIAVVVPLEQTGLVEEDIEGAIHAKELYNVISKFKSDEIVFTLTKDNTLLIKSGKAKVEMNFLDFDYKSRIDGITTEDDLWEDLPEDFELALASCRMTNNKSKFTGLFMSGNVALSTDGFQIHMYEMKKNVTEFYISDSTLNELVKIKGLKRVQVRRNWVHFETDNCVIFSAKTLNANNFPFDKIMGVMQASNPDENDFHATFPMEVFFAIERADNFALDINNDSVVRLTISKDKIGISSEKASGKYNEDVEWEKPIEGEFEPIIVYVNNTMIQTMGTHSLEFYIKNMVDKKGRGVPRFLFVTESSKHLMNTVLV